MTERKKYFEGVGTAAYERKKKYNEENYKRLNIVLKPEVLEAVNRASAAAGKSKNGWLVEAITEKLERE